MMTHGNEMSADAYEPYDFANRRHIGPSPEEIAEMLRVVGVSSLEALIDETVPKDIRLGKALDYGRPLSERGALDRLRETPIGAPTNRPHRAHNPAHNLGRKPRPGSFRATAVARLLSTPGASGGCPLPHWSGRV